MKTKNDILIKVLSLSIGLSVGIGLIAKVFFELSYDSFYKDIDRVYTIRNYYSQHGDEHDYGQVSGAVLVGFMEEVPGIEVGTRTTFVSTVIFIWMQTATSLKGSSSAPIPAFQSLRPADTRWRSGTSFGEMGQRDGEPKFCRKDGRRAGVHRKADCQRRYGWPKDDH